jgi:5'-nucleotidase
MSKKIVYVDMDNVLVDFPSGIEKLSEENKKKYEGNYDEVPGIFSLMEPMPGAIEGFEKIAETYDTYILSTAPWGNRTAWSDKLDWVKQYLGDTAHKRLILSHNKNLNRGDYLIDDRTKNGAGEFQGELIHFGTSEFPHWKSVTDYLLG